MQELYCMPAYKKHLKRRKIHKPSCSAFFGWHKRRWIPHGKTGYLPCKGGANTDNKTVWFWCGFLLTGVTPPSRGGGKTHKFYASMGNNISSKEIQLHHSGANSKAPIWSNRFSSVYIEQLLNAGATNLIFKPRQQTMSCKDEELLQELSSYGFDEYIKLKKPPSSSRISLRS